MAELPRSQLLVYAAVAVAVLLLGARALRTDDGESAQAFGPGSPPTMTATTADGGASVERGGRAVVVHVAGDVVHPGVYRLRAGSRVADALEEAGGPRRTAALDAVNLAAKLVDGQQVVVPTEGDGGGTSVAGGAGGSGEEGPISLGSASQEDLERIDGIGPKTAEKIVAFRSERGGIGAVDDLEQVDGIGPKTLEKLRSELQP